MARRTAASIEKILRAGRTFEPEADDAAPPELTLDEPGLAACYAAAAQGISVSGDRAGLPTLRLVFPPEPPPRGADTGPLAGEPVAEVRGINVHARDRCAGCRLPPPRKRRATCSRGSGSRLALLPPLRPRFHSGSQSCRSFGESPSPPTAAGVCVAFGYQPAAAGFIDHASTLPTCTSLAWTAPPLTTASAPQRARRFPCSFYLGARDPALWTAIGRIGARIPIYASAHYVISPGSPERFLDHLLREKWHAVPTAAPAAVLLARRTGDRARDISDAVRLEVARALAAAGAPDHDVQCVREVVAVAATERAAWFEDLPAGLRLLD